MVPGTVRTTSRRLFLQSIGWLASGAFLSRAGTARALAARSGPTGSGPGAALCADATPRRSRSVRLVNEAGRAVLIRGPRRCRIGAINRTGARIWGWVDGNRTVAQIAGLLQAEEGFPAKAAYPHCHCFLMLLVRKGALEPC